MMSKKFLQFLCEDNSVHACKLEVCGDMPSCKARIVFKFFGGIGCDVYCDKVEYVNICDFVAVTQSL